jgi:hypothetical protein
MHSYAYAQTQRQELLKGCEVQQQAYKLTACDLQTLLQKKKKLKLSQQLKVIKPSLKTSCVKLGLSLLNRPAVSIITE